MTSTPDAGPSQRGEWAVLDEWLTRWFDYNLTHDAIADRTDDEWASCLVADMAADGFTVTKGSTP